MTDDARRWEDWKEHYEQLGIDKDKEICRDGIVNEAQYSLAPHKVLFVLKETNGRVEGLDLRIDLDTKMEKLTWWTTARWAAGIQRGFSDISSLTREELHNALRSTACINLKKTAGGASSNMTEIGIFAFRDRKFLKRQIEAIKPEYIIACGTIEILLWLLEAEKDKTNTLGEPLKCKGDAYNAVLVPICHPGNPRISTPEKYSLLANLFGQIPEYKGSLSKRQ